MATKKRETKARMTKTKTTKAKPARARTTKGLSTVWPATLLEPTLEHVAVSALASNPVQGSRRRERDQLFKLDVTIGFSKRMVPPHVAVLPNGKKLVLDGHHRVDAAKRHHLKTVQCLLWQVENEAEAEVLFILFNAPPVDVSAVEEMAVLAHIAEAANRRRRR